MENPSGVPGKKAEYRSREVERLFNRTVEACGNIFFLFPEKFLNFVETIIVIHVILKKDLFLKGIFLLDS